MKLAAIWGVAPPALQCPAIRSRSRCCSSLASSSSLSFNSVAQTLVQLHAPDAARRRVRGLYGMAASGLRTFSGITVGLAGSFTSIHTPLAISSALFVGVCLALFRFVKLT